MLRSRFLPIAPMKTTLTKTQGSRKKWHHGAALFAFVLLVSFALAPSAAQQKSAKRITGVKLGSAADGSRVSVFSEVALNDYEAFRRGDRFYVRIPAADFVGSKPQLRGSGFQDVIIQEIGDSVVISFWLQPGASARVEQRASKLDVVFSGGTGSLTTANASQSRAAGSSYQSDQAGPMPPATGTTGDNWRSYERPGSDQRSTSSRSSETPRKDPNGSTTANSTSVTGSSPSKSSTAVVSSSPDSTLTSTNPNASESPSSTGEPQIASATPGPSAQPYASPAKATSDWRNSYALQWFRLNQWIAITTGVLILIALALLIWWAVSRIRWRPRAQPEPVAKDLSKPKTEVATADVQASASSTTVADILNVPSVAVTEPDTVAESAPLVTDESVEDISTTATATPTAPFIPLTIRTKETLPTSTMIESVSDSPEAKELISEQPFSNTTIPYEHADAEIRNLLAGKEFDVQVIDSKDAITRQVVAASLLAAITGRSTEQHEPARRAFMDHGYFDEATRDLRTADSPAQRASAARKLGVVGNSAGTAHLIAALHDSAPEVRRSAVESMGQIGDPEAVPALNELLLRENSRQLPEAVIRHAINSIVVTEAKHASVSERPNLRVVEKQKPLADEDEREAFLAFVGATEPQEADLLLTSAAPFSPAPIEVVPPRAIPSLEEKLAAEEQRLLVEEEALRRAADELEDRKREAEVARRKAEDEARLKAEREAQLRLEVEAHIRAEEEARQKAVQDAQLRAEVEARIRAEEVARARAEEDARRRASEEAARRLAEEEARLKAEQEDRVRVEAEAQLRAEEEARFQLEAQTLRRAAQEIARKRAETESARKLAEEETRKRAEEEMRRRVEEEVRRRAEEEARLKAEAEVKRRLEEEARIRAEIEAQRVAEEARIRAEAEAEMRRLAEEARLRAEAEARRLAEEARIRAEAEAEMRRQAEEAARLKAAAEAEARRVAEEARLQAEAEAEVRRQAEEARSKAQAEARRQALEEARLQYEEEQRLKAEAAARAAEEARRQAEIQRRNEEERLKREAEERRELETQQLQMEQEALVQAAADLMRRRTAIEESRKTAQEEARLLAETEERVRAEEEATRQQVAEERARLEAEAQQRINEDRKRSEEARRQAEQRQRQAEEEAQRLAEEDERRLMELEALRKRTEEEGRRRAEKEQRIRTEIDALRRAEEEQRRRIETETQRRVEMEERLKEEQARQQAEELARRKAEEESLKLTEEARLRTQEEAKRRQQAEAILREQEERRQAEEAVRLKAQEETQRLAEAARQRAEEEARQRLEAEQQLKAEEARIHEEEAFRLRAEEETRRLSDEARKRAEEEAQHRAQAEERLQIEAARLRSEEAARIKAQEERQRLEDELRQRADEEAQRRAEAEARLLEERERAQAQELAEVEARQQFDAQVFQSPAVEDSIQSIAQELETSPVSLEEDFAWVDISLERNEHIELPMVPEVAQASVEEPAAAAEPIKGIDVVHAEKGIVPIDNDSDIPAEVISRLNSVDVSDRSSALSDLARLGGDDAFHHISKSFDDQSPEVRNAAARALYSLHSDRAASFTRALREGSSERRRRIGSSLAASGLATDAIGNLTGESREKTYDAFSLLFLMAKAGEVQPLLKAIEDYPNVEVRLAVVKLLALSGQSEIVPAFRRLAVRGSLPSEVRSAVMEAIYQISSQTRETAPSAA